MSLFDGQAERGRERKTSKAKTIHKGKLRSDDQALLDDRYGPGSRSASKTTAAQRTREERRTITEAYERGELKFEDCSEAFLLCHCDRSEFPHDPHRDEIATFELQHYGTKK